MRNSLFLQVRRAGIETARGVSYSGFYIRAVSISMGGRGRSMAPGNRYTVRAKPRA